MYCRPLSHPVTIRSTTFRFEHFSTQQRTYGHDDDNDNKGEQIKNPYCLNGDVRNIHRRRIRHMSNGLNLDRASHATIVACLVIRLSCPVYVFQRRLLATSVSVCVCVWIYSSCFCFVFYVMSERGPGLR